MLTKWFGKRTPRAPAKEGFFRPQLEVLEDRLPPSAMHGGDGGNNVHIMNNVHNNVHIVNSFNGSTLMNAFNGQNLGLLAVPQSTLQSFFTTLYTQAAAINSTAANNLVGEEAQLAIDAFLTFEGVGGLDANITALQSAIASNEATLGVSGILLGQVTFDVVLDGLVSSSL